jgi:hypothetical protein
VWPAWLFVLSLAVLSLLFHSLMRMMLSSSVQLSLAVLSSSSYVFPDGRSIMTVCMSAPVDLHLVYSNHFPGQCAKHAYVLDFPHSNAGCSFVVQVNDSGVEPCSCV